MNISIIVPLLNEAAQLPDLLAHLLECKRAGCEIILVDGGSSDQSPEQAEALGFTVLRSEKGRAIQMNAGAKSAKGDVLVFLHADTRLPENADQIIKHVLEDDDSHWGRFNVNITGQAFMFKVIAWFMNNRSRLSSIVTGDQTIFIRKTLFEQIGGFPVQALMEDIEFSKRLKIISKPVSLTDKVITSGRRWEQKGIWLTIYLMWSIRFAYWRGASAKELAIKYR
ncbi:MAG: rSAM/selenodomain-associated transferase 2 [Oleiphilaceae bacterium]|jgi:rSAM/selenodomain-associated transferase 2